MGPITPGENKNMWGNYIDASGKNYGHGNHQAMHNGEISNNYINSGSCLDCKYDTYGRSSFSNNKVRFIKYNLKNLS